MTVHRRVIDEGERFINDYEYLQYWLLMLPPELEQNLTLEVFLYVRNLLHIMVQSRKYINEQRADG